MSNRSLYGLIVAGGSGQRMKSEVPKQFLTIADKPVMVHTISAFYAALPDIQLIVVLPEAHIELWGKLQRQYFPDKNILIAKGGNERFDSVKSGLQLIPDDKGLVAIHDSVRPCIDPIIIRQTFSVASEKGNAIVCVPLKDSIREKIGNETTQNKARDNYLLVQTPQVFEVGTLKDAYQQCFNKSFTDDASVFEQAGHQIHLVEGRYSNIKITTPEDLAIASYYLGLGN